MELYVKGTGWEFLSQKRWEWDLSTKKFYINRSKLKTYVTREVKSKQTFYSLLLCQ